jgi:hypothetical protein
MNLMNRSLGAVVFGLLASAGVCAQEETQEPKRIIGSLQDVEGTVLIKRGEESIPVVEGQQVWETDSVLVTESARALLVFVDGCDMQLDPEELYEVPRRSPCATLWWAGPAAAATACGVAHVDESENSQALAAVGLAVGAGLVGAAQGRETKFREYAAALESAEGEVMATNAAGELEPIRPGTRLRAEQQVVVKDGAKALIRFDDGCTKAMEIGKDGQESYTVPANSPCFTPPLWWASTAAAVGLCVTAEDRDDVSSP